MTKHTALRATLAAALLVPAAALGQPVSHLNQPILEHVVLEAAFSEEQPYSTCTWRYRPDSEERRLLVPQGRRLVITDVEWQALPAVDDKHFRATAGVWIDIFLGGLNDNDSWRVFRSRTLGAKQAALGASEQSTTGFVVPPDTPMCVLGKRLEEALGLTPFYYGARLWCGNLTSFGGPCGVLLRGYLIDAP